VKLCIAATLVLLLLPPVFASEVSIQTDGNRVTVGTATFQVLPADSIAVENEPYTLSSEKPDRWAKGTHLKACLSRVTPLPDCLVPGSVVVKLEDGTTLERDKDYLLDERWASLARLDGGKIGKDTRVLFSYRAGQMRLHSIQINPDGKIELVPGQPRTHSPEPPPIRDGWRTVANVFMPYHTKAVESWQIFRVAGPYPEPNETEMSRRSELVPKTLNKLRAGQPVHIVTWGDSVTAGGDASSPATAFPELFATRLRERFPKSTITLTNAGIGATNTNMRLPNLQKDVLAFHPDLVTIEFVNDLPLAESVLRKNYASALQQLRNAGAEVILITPHFVMPEMMGHKFPRGGETRPNVELLRKIAAENHIGLADVSKRWEHLESEGLPYITLLDNGINHPDDRGHQLFVTELLTFFPAK
jgi:lysophospholipase L1-like esterase